MAGYARSQDTARHDPAVVTSVDDMAIDTSMDYDELMNDLDLFLDSILSPRSYFLANLSVGQGYFNFTNRTNTRIKSTQKFVWSPTLGYYAKGGFGVTLSGSMVRDSVRLKFYQLSLSPSYDYLKNRKLAAGISYIRYFTKDSLPFYTSPLQNEVNAYFLWRKSWLKPSIAASYGWGSRSEYNKRQRFIARLLKRAVVITNTEESIADFSLTFSLRHDFYWLNIFSKKDNIRFSPQLSFAGGSQKFGFNQTSGTYVSNSDNVLYSAGSVNLDKEMKFQPLSLTLYLRAEYSVGKFFIQPQLLLDYYFPGEDKNFTTLFSLNLGFMF
jgi:hypothetical protein